MSELHARRAPCYATVVLDVDSTLSGIEGIDWLAARRSQSVRQRVRAATTAAMRGEIALESVYGERLRIVAPTADEIAALAESYIRAIAPGARDAITRLRAAAVRVVIVSGGILEAIAPLAAHVGIPAPDVHAVSIRFDSVGRYAGYDDASPLAAQGGKPTLVRSLALPAPIAALGDGMTDAELREVVALFVAFTGFAQRDPVVARADAVAGSFATFLPLVLG